MAQQQQQLATVQTELEALRAGAGQHQQDKQQLLEQFHADHQRLQQLLLDAQLAAQHQSDVKFDEMSSNDARAHEEQAQVKSQLTQAQLELGRANEAIARHESESAQLHGEVDRVRQQLATADSRLKNDAQQSSADVNSLRQQLAEANGGGGGGGADVSQLLRDDCERAQKNVRTVELYLTDATETGRQDRDRLQAEVRRLKRDEAAVRAERQQLQQQQEQQVAQLKLHIDSITTGSGYEDDNEHQMRLKDKAMLASIFGDEMRCMKEAYDIQILTLREQVVRADTQLSHELRTCSDELSESRRQHAREKQKWKMKIEAMGGDADSGGGGGGSRPSTAVGSAI
jgi:hypothetical protein